MYNYNNNYYFSRGGGYHYPSYNLNFSRGYYPRVIVRNFDGGGFDQEEYVNRINGNIFDARNARDPLEVINSLVRRDKAPLRLKDVWEGPMQKYADGLYDRRWAHYLEDESPFMDSSDREHVRKFGTGINQRLNGNGMIRI